MTPALPTSIVGWWQPENQKWSFELLLLISSSSASMPKHAMREHNMQMQLDTPDSRSPRETQGCPGKICEVSMKAHKSRDVSIFSISGTQNSPGSSLLPCEAWEKILWGGRRGVRCPVSLHNGWSAPCQVI